MRVSVIKYSSGNVGSVVNSLRRLGVDASLTDNATELRHADKVIFPGVGQASSAMHHLRERGLDAAIRSLTQPVLAICLGMQLLCAHSEEGEVGCLGILPHRVRRMKAGDLKVPHMGWNLISELRSPLFDRVDDDVRVYFAHSYLVETCDDSIAACDYGPRFTAALRRDNFHGVQFHPEKSGAVGMRILENFLAM